MIIPKRLLKCVSTDADRPQLQYVYADVEGLQVWATNGRIAVCLPITPDDIDVSGYIPRGAIEAADKQSKHAKGFLLHGEKTSSVPGVGTWDNPDVDGAFPLQLLRDMCHSYGNRCMCVDIALLKLACEGLGVGTYVEVYHDPYDTEMVLYVSYGGSEAIIQPLSTSNAEKRAQTRMHRHCAEEGIDF